MNAWIVDEPTPQEAVTRLVGLCDELERLGVPVEQVAEVRDLLGVFERHIQARPVLWERLRDYARRQML